MLLVGCAVIGIVLLRFLLFQPVIDQSAGFVEPSSVPAKEVCLSLAMPKDASMYRHVSASVGLGGRLTAYRFLASIADLQKRALAEFAAYPESPVASQSRVPSSPISQSYIEFLEGSCQCELEWLSPPNGSGGIEYYVAPSASVYIPPLIFVDEANETLYFIATD